LLFFSKKANKKRSSVELRMGEGNNVRVRKRLERVVDCFVDCIHEIVEVGMFIVYFDGADRTTSESFPPIGDDNDERKDEHSGEFCSENAVCFAGVGFGKLFRFHFNPLIY